MRGHCTSCCLAREVELMDRSRILVCDGGCDEMVQVSPMDTCELYEELYEEPAAARAAGEWRAALDRLGWALRSAASVARSSLRSHGGSGREGDGRWR